MEASTSERKRAGWIGGAPAKASRRRWRVTKCSRTGRSSPVGFLSSVTTKTSLIESAHRTTCGSLTTIDC